MLLRIATQLSGRFAGASNTLPYSARKVLLAPRLIKPQNNEIFVRQYARGPREPPVNARAEIRRGPTLKEKFMGPPSANGMYIIFSFCIIVDNFFFYLFVFHSLFDG